MSPLTQQPYFGESFFFFSETEQSVYKNQYTMVLLAELIVIIVEKQLET